MTDDGTTHHSGGGGGSSLSWGYTIEPPIPDTVRELRVFAGPDGERPGGGEISFPAEPSVVVRLPPWKVVTQRAAATTGSNRPPASHPGRGPDLQGRSVRPLAVVAVCAQLDEIGGRDICIQSVERYADWFLVHVAGSGPLAMSSPTGTKPHLLGGRCVAEDDGGGRYEGRIKSSHSGFPWSFDAPFAPALDPRARRLTLTFPNPFAAGSVRTAFVLPED